MTTTDELEYYCFKALRLISQLLAWCLPAILRFSKAHPVLTNALGYAIATYVLWKMVCHFIVFLKRLVYLSLIVLAIIVWYRGPSRVLSQDIPEVIHLLQTDPTIKEFWSDLLKYARQTGKRAQYSLFASTDLAELRMRFMRFLTTL